MYDEHETYHFFKDHNVEKDAGVMVQLCIASTTMVPAPVFTHAHCSTCSREASQLSRLSEGWQTQSSEPVNGCLLPGISVVCGHHMNHFFSSRIES